VTRRGYTLVEVTVALAITALVMTALASTVSESLRARTAATATLGRVTTARTVLLHLERELATALPEGFSVSASPAALRFTGGTEPGSRLTYLVDGGALVRRTEPRFATADTPAGATMALVDGVTALDLRALDGEAWTTTWAAPEPPRAVRIELTLDDGQALEIVIPIATGRRSARS